MILPPRVRKFALTTHVASSVGWLGAVVVFLALAVIGLTSRDPQTVRNASPTVHAVLALVALLVTTVLAVYKPRGMTPWGWRKQREQ